MMPSKTFVTVRTVSDIEDLLAQAAPSSGREVAKQAR
jgi:hypothetical protein